MVEGDLLPPSVLRQIGDKVYEKRKAAALEVEQIVKRLAAQSDQQHKIRAIIEKLHEFAYSHQANFRKGALLCLAAATVGLGEPTEQQLNQIVPVVLAFFNDSEHRVRYYACEALYNIAKVARESFISFFSEVFDAMFKLCADAEASVQSAVQFLDNLVKDIVTASPDFNIEAFIPKLKEYLCVVNPFKRQFLISWITVLDSVPDLNMLAYLPELLDGLMNMLSDPKREIKVAAHKAMMEFLVEIQATRSIDFDSLSKVLVEKSNSQDEFTRNTALKWLKEFVEIAPSHLLGRYASILGAVLPNVSHPSKDIQQIASEANNALLGLSEEDSAKVDTAAILGVISAEVRSEQEPTRLEAIRWIDFLLQRSTQAVFAQLPVLLPALLDALSAPSDRVVVQTLSVMAAIAAHPEHFRPVLLSLLNRFRGDTGLAVLQKGGSLVIRRLCAHMGSEKVFMELGVVLEGEKDLGFASTMVQALNLILLNSSETRDLRDMLREARSDPQGAHLFAALYPSWNHSTGALLSLCLLSQAYHHANDILHAFAYLPINAQVLLQMDRLVQLLETPPFTFLRLQLLQPARHPALLRALHSLLMLLPQSTAFRTLHARLSAVPTLALLQLDPAAAAATAPQEGSTSPGPSSVAEDSWADFPALLKLFKERRELHAAYEQQQTAELEGWHLLRDPLTGATGPARPELSNTATSTSALQSGKMADGPASGTGGDAPATGIPVASATVVTLTTPSLLTHSMPSSNGDLVGDQRLVDTPSLLD